jgi:hypothetical protein
MIIKNFKPTIAQKKRMDDAEALTGTTCYLKGTKYTTKIKGIIDSVEVMNPEYSYGDIKVCYKVLWEGQETPFYTNRSGFEL